MIENGNSVSIEYTLKLDDGSTVDTNVGEEPLTYTQGKSEILLMTTCPAFGRWETMNELAEAARIVAEEKKTGLADIASAFHTAGQTEESRLALYCSDRVHLGTPGHRLVAETVVRSISDKAPDSELRTPGL